jgi:hypothetical protein
MLVLCMRKNAANRLLLHVFGMADNDGLADKGLFTFDYLPCMSIVSSYKSRQACTCV